jgi:hypothetical protein
LTSLGAGNAYLSGCMGLIKSEDTSAKQDGCNHSLPSIRAGCIQETPQVKEPANNATTPRIIIICNSNVSDIFCFAGELWRQRAHIGQLKSTLAQLWTTDKSNKKQSAWFFSVPRSNP